MSDKRFCYEHNAWDWNVDGRCTRWEAAYRLAQSTVGSKIMPKCRFTEENLMLRIAVSDKDPHGSEFGISAILSRVDAGELRQTIYALELAMQEYEDRTEHDGVERQWRFDYVDVDAK